MSDMRMKLFHATTAMARPVARNYRHRLLTNSRLAVSYRRLHALITSSRLSEHIAANRGFDLLSTGHAVWLGGDLGQNGPNALP